MFVIQIFPTFWLKITYLRYDNKKSQFQQDVKLLFCTLLRNRFLKSPILSQIHPSMCYVLKSLCVTSGFHIVQRQKCFFIPHIKLILRRFKCTLQTATNLPGWYSSGEAVGRCTQCSFQAAQEHCQDHTCPGEHTDWLLPSILLRCRGPFNPKEATPQAVLPLGLILLFSNLEEYYNHLEIILKQCHSLTQH